MREIRYLGAMREALREEMRRDPSVFVVGEDVRHSLRGLTKGIFDDSNRTCGCAAELAALFADEAWDALRAPVRRITRADVPVPFSTPIETYVLPSNDRLLAEGRACLVSAGV